MAREQLRMTDDEVAAFLAESRRAQIATLNADGSPHVVPLSYAMVDGAVALWTDHGSQKIANLRRDPRLGCLVEQGQAFAEFRAVQLTGRGELIEDLAMSARVGLALLELAVPKEFMTDEIRQSVIDFAPKRIAVLVRPDRVVSWDHRKVAGLHPGDIGS